MVPDQLDGHALHVNPGLLVIFLTITVASCSGLCDIPRLPLKGSIAHSGETRWRVEAVGHLGVCYTSVTRLSHAM